MEIFNRLSKLSILIETRYKIYLLIFVFLLFVASSLQILGINSLLPTISSFFDNSHNIENEMLNNFSNNLSLKFGISVFLSLLFISVSIMIFSNLIFIFVIFLTSKLAFQLEKNLKIKISKKLLDSDYESFSTLNKENTMSMFILETQRFAILINSYADVLSRIILIFFLLFYLLLFFSNVLILLLFLFGFYLLIYASIRKKITYNSLELSNINEKTLGALQELFQSFREIKIFSLKKLYNLKFIDISNKLMKIRFFTSFISSSPRYFLEIIVFLIVLFFLLMIDGAAELKNSLSKYAVLFFIFFKIIPLFQGLFSQIVSAQSNVSSIDIIYKFVKVYELNNFKKNSDEELFENYDFKEIDFQNISYSIKEKPILKDVNLKISKNQLIGIIGESGIGKSVLLDVLMGFRKYNGGNIYFNKKEISQINLQNFFVTKCSILSQNSGIFNGTILNNILLGKELNENKLSDILKKCLLTDLKVDGKMDNFYNRNIKTLSGGQVQRVLIARCLYNDPKILIIDEGLNQLDIDNEKKLFKNLIDYNITMIMVYHRLSKPDYLTKTYKLKDLNLIKI